MPVRQISAQSPHMHSDNSSDAICSNMMHMHRLQQSKAVFCRNPHGTIYRRSAVLLQQAKYKYSGKSGLHHLHN
jgi:hypothetical protein